MGAAAAPRGIEASGDMPEIDYKFTDIERKWQARWRKARLFEADERSPRPKCYVLNMYPYPSGVLHMGHVINYTLGDVVARYKMLRGYNVMCPMGWDSFGMPAENAAIRTGVHPHEFTEKNIAHMRAQMGSAGWGYDWRREVATSHADYYRWTQWFFLKFYEKGLAVKKTAAVNWCESCATVLANEQVKDGGCERCGTQVAQKDMSQWFFRMSAYAERLLAGHETLRGKWPDAVLAMQEEWIGRSEGATVFFKVEETGDPLPVFTTRPDTLWGVTFMSVAPEHPILEKLLKGSPHERRVMPVVRELRAMGTSEKELAEREKVGVFTGFHVVNPVNGEAVPLWAANFALMAYGTGAVMSVPAHDQRDFEFARKYGLPIVPVILPPEGLDPAAMTCAYVDPGTMVASGPFTGATNTEAMPRIIRWLDEEGRGKAAVNYRLRDWTLSRQRYWGAPIPIIYCDACGMVPVPEKDLPVVLPEDVKFSRGGNPLATSESFVKAPCPRCTRPARRETDTMDTFVDSSWYFLRYCDAANDTAPFSPARIAHWMPVDQYIGGIEHATMHLIYARFFTMVLHDLGLLDFDEPFARLFCQGMVCKTAYYCEKCKWLPERKVEGGTRKGDAIEDGVCAACKGPVRAEMTKISKTKLNIVDPDAMIAKYGADTVRLYMLSDAPPDRMQVWSEDGINGAWRTLVRLWNLATAAVAQAPPVGTAIPADLDAENRALRRTTHQLIESVTGAIEGGFHFNTAVARCNELVNQWRAMKDRVHGVVLRETLETIVRVLSPIVPHFAEEIWERLGHEESIFAAGWPAADAAVAAEEMVEIPVQINGKLRGRVMAPPDATREDLERAALADEKVKKLLEGRTVAKVIVVPGRLVNIAVKG